MSHHNRKRTRTNNRSSNNSFASLASQSSEEETAITTNASQTKPVTIESYTTRLHKIVNDLLILHNEFVTTDLNLSSAPPQVLSDLHSSYATVGEFLSTILDDRPALMKHEDFSNIRKTFQNSSCADNRVDVSVSTEPPSAPPTYNNVACMAVTAPTPSFQPLNPSPSPKPGPRPPCTTCPKKAHPLTPRPRSHQVRKNVRLVACIAGRSDALTSETPRWKVVPTDCFSTLSKELKTIAPGCTPLSFHCNKKGNLIISFTPSTPRSLLLSKFNFIQGAFELAHHVPILFDTPRSTIHLAHVQARSQDGSPIFDQSALAESILANPALSALPLISQPRWLRHPSKITGIRSSAVLTFEDPDGAIARQLLNTPIFVFGQPVTVKPWINKPSISTRHPRTGSAGDLAPMDI